MVNTLFDTVWRDISPFAVGFDRTFDALSIMANSKSQSINYPPYNIRKVSDEKYTIELAIAGFEDIISGSILKDGICISNNLENTSVQNRKMGMVFQDYALFPNMDVKSNIGFGLQNKTKKEKFSRYCF